MKAVSSLYFTSVAPGATSLSPSEKIETTLALSPTTAPSIKLPAHKPKITILNKGLLLKLQKLTKSFQAQVRNSVALIKWLHAKTVSNPSEVSSTTQESRTWQSSFGESLSFRFSTSPEAFVLFTDTLLRKSYFLHHHAQVNPESQLIKVRVAVSRLPKLEQELSIVFENIKPINYLESRLLQKHPSRFPKRPAG